MEAVKSPMPADRMIHIQTEAAKRLIVNLRDQGAGDDAELIADSIEGQTNLVEAIEEALSEIDECEILIVGLEEKIKAFDARKKMQKDRAERIRALIEQALVATDQKSMKLAAATISLATRAPALVVETEADIPAKFWIVQERPAPKLDKKALTEALKANEIVPGATLDNGSVSLTVRRR
ncbi:MULTISPECIES: siphovirus Gp157 family protein [unclassified Rhizobium]|uniref:siphovirus Gp157 family protein n=1 Tax=unclassified Rhizobium TaxID=2613769 RepID=UPI001FFE0A80|nr:MULTISPECIES: siphovirus Gp157 family protein [unclassified Rhizobium]